MTKKKNQPRKNLLMQIGVVILLIAFVAYFILSNVLVRNETSNKDLDKAVSSKTAFSFIKEGELLFTNSKGDTITKIDIEIADDDEQRATGLMYRDKMDENQGMLFIFEDAAPRYFWMKNTYISLDIIYIGADKKIVSVQKSAVPLSEESLPSYKESMYVVEVNAGFFDKYGLKVGDIINFN